MEVKELNIKSHIFALVMHNASYSVIVAYGGERIKH